MKDVLRLADWVIGPTRDNAGSAVALMHEVQCVTCEEASRPDAEQAVLDAWAMRHTDSCGHRDYFQFTTARRTVSPAPAGQLHKQGREGAR